MYALIVRSGQAIYLAPRARPMAYRPFPYDRLPKLTRRQIALLRAIATAWSEPDTARALQTARELLGREIAWHAATPVLCEKAGVAARFASNDAALALRIDPSGEALPAAIVLEVPHRTAHGVVDRALGGEGAPLLPLDTLPLDELSRGALAYVAARVLAAAHAGLCVSELRALREATAWLEEGAYAVVPLTLTLGGESCPLAIYLPERLTVGAAQRERAPSRELGALPLTLIASAGVATLPLSAAKSLRAQDVIVLDRSSLLRDGDHYRGHVSAHVAGSSSRIVCRVCDAGLEVEAFTHWKEPNMTSGRIHEQTTPSAGEGFANDAPIELQVELARFALTLAELQRMQPGDVLATGRRIGEHVTVRMAGRTLAEGELVDVEGEVGVRLLRFVNE
jgi:type III secretion system YscQ/HrcQ family protein